jgi:hypothetical protein
MQWKKGHSFTSSENPVLNGKGKWAKFAESSVNLFEGCVATLWD